MKHIIKVNSENGNTTVFEANEESSVLSALRDNGFSVVAPCGGNGSCGKCEVKMSQYHKDEYDFNAVGITADTYVLACKTKVDRSMEIWLEEIDGKGFRVSTQYREKYIKPEPIISKKLIEIDKPSLLDQASDFERLEKSMKKTKVSIDVDLLRNLPALIANEVCKFTVVLNETEIIGFESGDTDRKLYGIAIDIGTTTIAVYLADLNTGRLLAEYGFANKQSKFGADVLSRIKYTIDSKYGLDELNDTLTLAINEAIAELCKKHNIEREDIYEAVFVGNTTMLHFLTKVPCDSISRAPFTPVFTNTMLLKAERLGIFINPGGIAVIAPSVSAYVGADTVSAVLSTNIYKSKEISLLIDLGTNGEMVLGCKDFMYACSTAAGPAFEGANIKDGVGSVWGAIDSCRIDDDIAYTTIGQGTPIGICGTGLISIAAEMIRKGIIDETGRLMEKEMLPLILGAKLTERIERVGGRLCFVIVPEEEGKKTKNICITQKDIRELQNAKAAIYAGIMSLVKNAGLNVGDIKKVYLAGGFGSYISIQDALDIGLLPEELKERIHSVGNAAGAGACEMLLSKNKLKASEKIKESIKYIELSACKDFNEYFIEAMLFPE